MFDTLHPTFQIPVHLNVWTIPPRSHAINPMTPPIFWNVCLLVWCVLNGKEANNPLLSMIKNQFLTKVIFYLFLHIWLLLIPPNCKALYIDQSLLY